MGFRIEIGGTEIKGDTPDETLKDAVNNVKRVAQTAAQAFSTGDLESFKSLAGQLILNNNLATLGAVKAAQEIFPQVPAESFEKVVGAGVLTFLMTGDVTLTVYSVTNEFLGIYSNLDSNEGTSLPAEIATPAIPERSRKYFTVTCLKIWRNASGNGKVVLYAGFHAGPTTAFTDSNGSSAIWPDVDLRKGDVVELTATENLAPTAESTVGRAKGVYTGISINTPGSGPNQVTLLLKFDEE